MVSGALRRNMEKMFASAWKWDWIFVRQIISPHAKCKIACATNSESALEQVDAIIAPTVPITAPLIGENVVQIESAEEPVRGALIRLNRPANFTGLPAISLPCGWSAENLPIGLQLIGSAWAEEQLADDRATFRASSSGISPTPPPILNFSVQNLILRTRTRQPHQQLPTKNPIHPTTIPASTSAR